MINPIQFIKKKVVDVTRTNKAGTDRQELLSHLYNVDILELQRDFENAVLVLDSRGEDIDFWVNNLQPM